MKSKIILLTLLFCPSFMFGQTWDYPIKPGTEEWKKLNSHQDMVEICQVPSNILPTIPTNELIEICLNYPLFFTMKAFNNLQEGFNQVSTEFNGFQELFKRKDAGILLLKVYETYNPEDVQRKNDLLSKGLYEQRIFFIEFILSQPIVFEKLSTQEKRILLSETLVKAGTKAKAGFSTFNRQITSLIAVRVLENDSKGTNSIKNAKENKFKRFSTLVILTDKTMIDEIKNATVEYLNQK